jgi:hypothetical protein
MLGTQTHCIFYTRNTNTLYSLYWEHKHIVQSILGTQTHCTVNARNINTLYSQSSELKQNCIVCAPNTNNVILCSKHNHILQSMLGTQTHCTVYARNTNTLLSLCSQHTLYSQCTEHNLILQSMLGTQSHITVYARNTNILHCLCSEHKHMLQLMLGTQTHSTVYARNTNTLNI